MIKANELRIGNLVLLCFEKKTWQVLQLNSSGINGISYKKFSGIPVSEEILFKCGFAHRSFYVVGAGSCFKWQLGDFILLKDFNEKFYLPTMPNSVVLESLHHLQNLYFALTGQELNTSGLI